MRNHETEAPSDGLIVSAPRVILDTPASAGQRPAALSAIDFAFDSYYDVLGVSTHATTRQVGDSAVEQRARYQAKAQKESDPAANERMALINKAKDILSNPEKRAAYDLESDSIFLSIQDPAWLPPLEWADGLRLIKKALAEPADEPAAADPGVAGLERRNAMLDELLR